jgi:hypothetical protein
MKKLFFVLFCTLMFGTMQKATAQCPISFNNYFLCAGSVDISWTFNGCSPTSVCGSNSASGVTGLITIPCESSCATPGTCDITITVTAIGGCPITPTSLSWSTAVGSGGKAYVILPCPTGNCTVPPNCCDTGTELVIDTSLGAYVH